VSDPRAEAWDTLAWMARYGRQSIEGLRKMKLHDFRSYQRSLADMHRREFPPRKR
jgi:hypothetical protein